MLYHLLKYMSWWTRFEVCYWLSVIFVRDNELCAFECVCFSWVECGMPCHVLWWEGARHGIVVGGFIRAELTSGQNWMNKMRYFPRMFLLGIFWGCPKCPLQRVSTRKISKIPIRLVRQYAERCDSTGGTDSAGASAINKQILICIRTIRSVHQTYIPSGMLISFIVIITSSLFPQRIFYCNNTLTHTRTHAPFHPHNPLNNSTKR